jgi:hypothetical protein
VAELPAGVPARGPGAGAGAGAPAQRAAGAAPLVPRRGGRADPRGGARGRAAGAGGGLSPEPLLEQLRTGLLEKPSCAPNCASFGRLALEASGDRLRLRLEASAAARTAVSLPGASEQWRPADVLVDGKPSTALASGEEGSLWLLLEPGGHQIVLEGPLPDRPSVQLRLGELRPHAVEASLRGWTLEGVDEDGGVGETLQLTRVGRRQGEAGQAAHGLEAQSLPPYVSVERTLRLGLKWEVETRVVRTTPTGVAVVLEVPLLPNESVVTEGVKVSKGKVQVNMGADEDATEWRSVLEQRSPIVLQAPKGEGIAFAEVWRVDLGPLWHATFAGIPPVHPGDATGGRMPEWRPWPGESVTVAVARPGGTPGQTVTIDASQTELRPGARTTEATLTLRLRSSRGGQHTVTLPEGATLDSLKVQGAEQPLRQDGRKVTFPLGPGERNVSLTFRVPAASASSSTRRWWTWARAR